MLFEHDLWHSCARAAGTKLVLRTDVPSKPPHLGRRRPAHATGRGRSRFHAVGRSGDALEAIGLLDCGVEALLAPGRAAYAAMLADAPGAQVDRLWAAAVAEASALPVAPANTRAVVT